jgi:hypothetical protein
LRELQTKNLNDSDVCSARRGKNQIKARRAENKSQKCAALIFRDKKYKGEAHTVYG